MRRRIEMTAKGFVIGMLVGGVVGAGAALLFAPMKGEETRRKIAETSRSATEKVGKAASSVKGRVSREREPVKQAM
jgi:gas vesicle protein